MWLEGECAGEMDFAVFLLFFCFFKEFLGIIKELGAVGAGRTQTPRGDKMRSRG